MYQLNKKNSICEQKVLYSNSNDQNQNLNLKVFIFYHLPTIVIAYKKPPSSNILDKTLQGHSQSLISPGGPHFLTLSVDIEKLIK